MAAFKYKTQPMNRRVTIQRRATGQDANGEPSTSWVDVATVWAGIRDMNGREYIAAAAVQNDVTTRITIRYLDGVAPAMRVMHGAIAYDIEAVLGQDNRSLMLMCKRAV